MTTVYKVVRKWSNGDRTSACTRQPSLSLKYLKGAYAYPAIGKIFAFGTYGAAVGFMYSLAFNYELWEAHMSQPPTPAPPRIPQSSLQDITKWWRDGCPSLVGKLAVCLKTPFGTVLCDDLKLVRMLLDTWRVHASEEVE